MWVTKVELENIRGFKKETIELSRGINLLVGPNNSGKSTIAYAVLSMQQPGYTIEVQDIRTGENTGKIQLSLKDVGGYRWADNKNISKVVLTLDSNGKKELEGDIEGGGVVHNLSSIPAIEPKNFIYPYLAKRKVNGYAEQINEGVTNQVTGRLDVLYAKVDRLSNPQLPGHQYYVNACQRILGFVVTCVSSASGKKACYVINNFNSITVDKMGEGIASILGMVVDLCIAENKLFIIEEPENDIHPKALKGVLKLITEKSHNNQFLITTHSNIVTRFLGSEEGTKIYSVNVDYDERRIPTSKVDEIENNPEARRELLEGLGYELNDWELWEGWLFLEEASAEKIIRQYLIRWFTPYLQGKLRTFSSHSLSEVELKFADFNRLFSFLNMSPAYKNRAWVIVDGGRSEKEIIDKLKQTYLPNGWQESQFLQFENHDFELYYPEEFKQKVEEVLKITDKNEKREAKKALLRDVEGWIRDDERKSKASFKSSAKEVIAKLKSIEETLNRET